MSQKLFHYVAFYNTLEGTMYYKNNLHNNKFPFEQLGLKMTDTIFYQQETVIGSRFSDLFNINIGVFDIQIPVYESRDKLTWISFECLFKSAFGTVYISNSINASTYKGNTYVDNLRYLLRVLVPVTQSLMTIQQQDQFQYLDHVTEIQSYYHQTHLETIINNEPLIQQSSVFVEKEVVTQPMYSPQNNDPLILPLPDYNGSPLPETEPEDDISLSSSSINVNTIMDDNDLLTKTEYDINTPMLTEEIVMNKDDDIHNHPVLLTNIMNNPIHDVKESPHPQHPTTSPTFKMPELRTSQDKTQTSTTTVEPQKLKLRTSQDKTKNSTTTVIIPPFKISSFFKK